MRVNVYTEEMTTEAEIVAADYISSRTGQPMTNYGIRIYQKSHPDLHHIQGRDDDRSAVTFWCGSEMANVIRFLQSVMDTVELK